MSAARLAELAARCDPAGKSPDELEPLTWAERTELAALLHAVFVAAINSAAKPAHRPAKDPDRKFWAVLEMVLDIERKVPADAAREAAQRNWELTPRQMKDAVLRHKNQAEEIAASTTDPAALAGAVKWQRDRK